MGDSPPSRPSSLPLTDCLGLPPTRPAPGGFKGETWSSLGRRESSSSPPDPPFCISSLFISQTVPRTLTGRPPSLRNSLKPAGVGKALHPQKEAEGRTGWGWAPEHRVHSPAVTWTDCGTSSSPSALVYPAWVTGPGLYTHVQRRKEAQSVKGMLRRHAVKWCHPHPGHPVEACPRAGCMAGSWCICGAPGPGVSEHKIFAFYLSTCDLVSGVPGAS